MGTLICGKVVPEAVIDAGRKLFFDQERTGSLKYERKKLGLWIIEANQTKFVVKFTHKAHNPLMVSDCVHWISWRKELKLYYLINTIRFRDLKTPRLVGSNQRTWFALTFLDGLSGYGSGLSSKKRLVRALLEMQSLAAQKPSRSIASPAWFPQLEISVVNGILTAFFSRYIDWPTATRAFLVLLKLIGTRTRHKKMLLHRDLGNPENVITNDQETWFIDFGSIRIESSWFMLDIMDIAFDRDTLGFDIELLSIYRREYSLFFHTRIPEIEIKKQFRFALLRRSVHALRFPEYRNQHLSFLKSHILQFHGFRRLVQPLFNTGVFDLEGDNNHRS